MGGGSSLLEEAAGFFGNGDAVHGMENPSLAGLGIDDIAEMIERSLPAFKKLAEAYGK